MEMKIGDEMENHVDVGHIENIQFRNEVKYLVEEYKPNKTKDCDIKMKIVLTDEQPIYERPRRLAVEEKKEVEKQIK